MPENKEASAGRFSELRKQAEEILMKKETLPADISAEEIRQTVHELRTHQIELELQNEALRHSQEELEQSRHRYIDLYDFAPMGYLTISAGDIIIEANLTAAGILGVERENLLNASLSDFIIPADQDIYYLCLKTLLEKGGSKTCELRMNKYGNDKYWVSCQGGNRKTQKNKPCIRIIINDISRRKQAEIELLAAHAKLKNNILLHKVMNGLLQLSLENFSLDEMLDHIINHIIKFPGLGLKPSGVIFLKEENSEYLVMKAHVNISEHLVRICSRRRIGECLCGRAALSAKVIFDHSSSVWHDIFYHDMSPHTHYCVPIINAEAHVLGVLTLFLPETAIRNKVIEETLVAASQIIAAILKRKKIETALREKTDLLTSVYATAKSVAFITTNFGRDGGLITSFSPGAEQIFGYSSQEAVGQPISLISTSANKKLIPTMLKRLIEGKKACFPDTVLQRKSGECFYANVMIHPLSNTSGNIIGTLGVAIDISDLKLAQAALRRTNEELEQRVEQRTMELKKSQQQLVHVEKLGALGRLSSSIAHEFSNPMQGIMTVLNGIIKRAVLDEDDFKLVQYAVEECRRLAALIRNLQDLNRPSSGKKEPVDLAKAINPVVLLCKNNYKRRNITLLTEYPRELPAVMAVADQIKQVILNLLNNAADACPNGGTIHVNIQVVDSEVWLRIKDDGIGIKPENINRIFEPFFTTKPEVKGTGLGLPVSFGIIKKHGGRLEVESEPGAGTTFTIVLPIVRASNET